MAEFVYPFNFVPSSGPRRPSQADGAGEDRPFQPLDRYEGRSGRIEFEVTPLSPLFVPDPEGTSLFQRGQNDQGQPLLHRAMDFFNVDGRLAIPGTSLKGAIRSVAEALSNSSFGVLDRGSDVHATFRKVTNGSKQRKDLLGRKWGIWRGDWEGGRILPVEQQAKVPRTEVDTMLGLSSEDDRADAYEQLRREYATTTWTAECWQLHTGAPHARVLQGTWSGRNAGTAALFTVPHVVQGPGQLARRDPHPNRPGWHKASLSWVNGGATQQVKGPPIGPILQALGVNAWHNTGPWPGIDFCSVDVYNFATRSNERRLCYCDAPATKSRWSGRLGSRTGFLWPRANWRDIATLARRDPNAARTQADAVHYVPLLTQRGAALPICREAREGFDRANGMERRPRDGDIVRFFELDGEVVEFGPVAMFKTAERASVRQLVETSSPELLPSPQHTRLCPASRLFGWAPEGETRPEAAQPVAGRVRVGFAWSQSMLDQTTSVPLQVQSSPRPGFYPFYVRAVDEATNQVGNYTTAPDDPWWPRRGRVRGRKFYLHHHDAIVAPDGGANTSGTAVERVQMQREQVKGSDPADLFTAQNVTAAVLPPDGQPHFRGEIEFESLAEYELGLLLWAVSLQDEPLDARTDLAHKVGRGKPHGLGSCRLHCRRVVLQDPVEGWRVPSDGAATDPGGPSPDADRLAPGEACMRPEEAARAVRVFKTWMMTGKEDDDPEQVARFEGLESVQHLRAVLRIDLVTGENVVRYAPDTLKAYGGFKFFVDERKKRADRGEQPLRTPSELARGERQTG